MFWLIPTVALVFFANTTFPSDHWWSNPLLFADATFCFGMFIRDVIRDKEDV